MPRRSVPAAASPTPQSDDVGAALALLKDALQEEDLRIRREGAEAMQLGDLDTASAVIDFARQLAQFRGRVVSLAEDWSKLESQRDAATPEVQRIVGKRFFGRRKRGDITPHEDYCRPILEILVELGGRARTRKVLDLLGERMNHVLLPKDRGHLPSDAHLIRWRNAAQWPRNPMVNTDGRLTQVSPHGVWEISERRQDLHATGIRPSGRKNDSQSTRCRSHVSLQPARTRVCVLDAGPSLIL